MTAPTPLPYNIWSAAVCWWTDACAANHTDPVGWWRTRGRMDCALVYVPRGCAKCPLWDPDSRGAKEWRRIEDAYQHWIYETGSASLEKREAARLAFLRVYREQTKALLERIRALPHTAPTAKDQPPEPSTLLESDSRLGLLLFLFGAIAASLWWAVLWSFLR